MSMIQPREYPSTVLAKDSQDNAEATASATAGNSVQRYYITGVDASYSDSAIVGLLQLKDDTTVVWEQYVNGAASISFPSPISAALRGTSFSAVLAASGTGGKIGKVNLRGYLI